jgi:hypothetical protein
MGNAGPPCGYDLVTGMAAVYPDGTTWVKDYDESKDGRDPGRRGMLLISEPPGGRPGPPPCQLVKGRDDIIIYSIRTQDPDSAKLAAARARYDSGALRPGEFSSSGPTPQAPAKGGKRRGKTLRNKRKTRSGRR